MMDYPLEQCKYCPKKIIMAHTRNSRMPVNPTPALGGNIELTGLRIAVAVSVTPDPQIARYMPHWADCPGAQLARRRGKTEPKKKPTPPQAADTLF